MKHKKRRHESDNDNRMQEGDRRPVDPEAVYISAQRSAVAAFTILALLGLTGWLVHTLFFKAPITDGTFIALLTLYVPFMVFFMLYTLSLNLQPVHFRFMRERVYFLAKSILLPVNALLSYAILYRALGLIDGGVPTSDPTTCLYFSIVTWTTLGYGDVCPSHSDRLLAASEAIIGYIVMVALIALCAEFLRYFRNKSYTERGLPQV